MTPLDAARRLLEANESGLLPSDANGACWYCYWHLLHDGSGHDPRCPWPVLPRIVAALEAAERLMRNSEEGALEPSTDSGEYVFCGLLEGDHDGRRVSECPWQSLVMALKGDKA